MLGQDQFIGEEQLVEAESRQDRGYGGQKKAFEEFAATVQSPLVKSTHTQLVSLVCNSDVLLDFLLTLSFYMAVSSVDLEAPSHPGRPVFSHSCLCYLLAGLPGHKVFSIQEILASTECCSFFLSNTGYCKVIRHVLFSLCLLPIDFQIKFKVLRAAHCSGPGYPEDHINSGLKTMVEDFCSTMELSRRVKLVFARDRTFSGLL